jgi:hypothetical protein
METGEVRRPSSAAGSDAERATLAEISAALGGGAA